MSKRRDKKPKVIKRVETKLSTNPTHNNTQYIQNILQLAIEAHSKNNLGQAKLLYEKVLGLAPDQPEALHFLGVIAHQVGNDKIAINLIKKALSLKPQFF